VVDQIANPMHPYDLSTINQVTLTPIVRRVLNSESAVISDWNYERVHGGAGDVGTAISGVYRFLGKAHDRNIEKDWSLIHKVVGTTATQDNPSESRYWKREVLAYQSGRLADLPGGLAAPRFLGTHEFSETVVGLWLEDISDEVGAKWPLEYYGVVARHLGQFNGAFLVERELPAWPWLSHDWLRALVEENATPGADRFRQTLDEPDLRRWFIDDDARRVFSLWEQRELYFDALNRLPQTLLHRDAFRRNLFVRHDVEGSEQIVAVDWTYVGIGAVGEDLGALIHASLSFSEVSMAEARALETICFEGYLKGLRDAGWHGDPRLVRLGYAAGAAMCFGIGYVGLELPPEDAYPWIEQAFGLPIDEFRILVAELRRFELDLADEARTLMAVL
jgi:hypothetical protein